MLKFNNPFLLIVIAIFSMSFHNNGDRNSDSVINSRDNHFVGEVSSLERLTLTKASGMLSETWTSSDIGNVGVSGSTTIENGVLTIQGSGNDIWNTSDGFHYYYKSITGDIDAIAKIEDITNQHAWTKAGIMIRATDAANSPHLTTVLSASSGAGFQGRLETGGQTLGFVANDVSAPTWVRIQRTGNTFRSYHSEDGQTWTQIGSQVELSLPTEVLIGFCITSRVNNTLATATITETNLLDLGGGVTIPEAPTNLSANLLSQDEIELSWNDNSDIEDGFVIERKAATGNFEVLYTTAANTTTYTDLTFSPGNSYTYRVSAFNEMGSSSYAETGEIDVPVEGDSWISADIGSVGAPGSTTIANGTLIIQGSGDDIWNTSDGFHYYYKSITGDIDAIAKVENITNQHAWTKAGIMIRASDAANSTHLMTVVSASSGAGFQGRLEAGGQTLGFISNGVSAPAWVRIRRTGNTFRSYHSEDGQTWTQIGSQVDLTLPTEVLIGFCITSRVSNTLATATITETNLLDLGDPDVTPENNIPDTQEYQALIDLYNSLNGVGWTNNTNWTDTNLPLSAWHGVTVVNGDVIEINLPANNLKGTIPRSIHLLEALKVINFSDNQIKGELPVQLARLPELEALYLNDNELGGVIDLEFSVMPKLKTIHLQNNNFRSIPDYSFNGEVDKSQVTLKAENNKLEFLYIENNLDLSAPLQSFTYIPQKPYGEPKIMGFIVGNTMELKVKMLGEANVYQWERYTGSTWTTIGTNSPNYEKTSVALTDAGRYRCRISNTIEGTGFEIVTEEIEVKVDGGNNTAIVNEPLD